MQMPKRKLQMYNNHKQRQVQARSAQESCNSISNEDYVCCKLKAAVGFKKMIDNTMQHETARRN